MLVGLGCLVPGLHGLGCSSVSTQPHGGSGQLLAVTVWRHLTAVVYGRARWGLRDSRILIAVFTFHAHQGTFQSLRHSRVGRTCVLQTSLSGVVRLPWYGRFKVLCWFLFRACALLASVRDKCHMLNPLFILFWHNTCHMESSFFLFWHNIFHQCHPECKLGWSEGKLKPNKQKGFQSEKLSWLVDSELECGYIIFICGFSPFCINSFIWN